MAARLWLVFVLIYLVRESVGLTKQNLGGLWVLNGTNGEYLNLKANVPGGIYSDLEKSGIIGDVFYGDNDMDTRWVSKRNWTYFRTFIMEEGDLNHNHINLVFEGLDTFATVSVNDEIVGRSENMFVRYVFEVKNKLFLGVNNVTVVFESPVEKAEKIYNEQLKFYEVKPTCVPKEYRGECHVNHIRKMQASFSWDWGPAFPSVGIWKGVYVEAYNSTQIRDVTVKTIFNNDTDSWDIHLKTYLAKTDGGTKGNLVVTLVTDVTEEVNRFDLNLTGSENGEFFDYHTITIPKLQVKLWWPNEYGNQTLYKLSIEYVSEDQRETDKKDLKIGFRTIELNQEKYEDGRAFFFIVNGIAIFAKGSNVIPVSILPERDGDSERIRFLLESAKDAHMNMVRVWGGGLYESDEFYNIADELGILVWQDFMFACSMYPTNPEFIESVKKEVRHQVRRLQHHPSIAIWAGNNENEAALRQNWYGTGSNFELYKKDYIKLYVDIIKSNVFENDDSRIFLTSSPTNGIGSEEEDYIAQNPQDQLYGDVHFYNYIADGWQPKVYPIPRFASEYGYQSLPTLKTLMTITNNITNLLIGSDLMEHRQHHPLGYIEMKMLISYRIKLPEGDDLKYLKALVFYGQIVQAMAIKVESEHYRRWKGTLEGAIGNTMGALYWQLNDVWVAPSWASIDFQLNWKMIHYFAKEFFAPIIITSELTPSRELLVFAVNDNPVVLTNLVATISVYKWDNFVPVFTENVTVSELADASVEVATFWVDTYLMDAGCGDLASAQKECFIYLSLSDNSGKAIAPNNYVFPSPLKDATLKEANVNLTSVEDTGDGKTFKIMLGADYVSLFVWLECQNTLGQFSENGFLQITKQKEIFFYSKSTTTANDLKLDITITHLMDKQYL